MLHNEYHGIPVLQEVDGNKVHALLRGSEEYSENEQKALKFRNDREEAKDETWKSIKKTQNEIFIDRTDIEKRMNDNLCQEDFEKIFDIIKKNGYPVPTLSPLETSLDQTKLPTFNNIIFFDFFMDSLRKPSNILDKDKFKVPSRFPIKDYASGQDCEMEYIELSRNLLSDIRISILPLHYVNLFVTCDKHLAALLVYLYPDYADKIRWYDQNNFPKRHR